jgi:ribosomal protein L9
MKVQLRVNVQDVGKDGDTVTVNQTQGNWLVSGGYAVEVNDPAPAKAKTKAPAKATAPKPAAANVAAPDAAGASK